MDTERRHLITLSAAAGAGLILTACITSDEKNENKKGGEVTATEDLMREHGVLRRALLIYTETTPKLRASASSVDPAALAKTANLFRSFGEDYHERN
ncbi:MAG TPA: hypothetical protein VFC63_03800 [Blastocatellia bacterium]|nr:hypothetical protein [Blastocatellia bacterium]